MGIAVQSRLSGVRLLTGVALLACMGSPTMTAQPASPQTDLQEILRHLQDNLWDFQATVPDFFADEHVVSVMQQEGTRDVKTTTDSVFRLVRSQVAGEATTFDESHEVRLINKKPAQGNEVKGPAVLSGVFSSALSVVSLQMSSCFDYTLGPEDLLKKQRTLTVDFSINPGVLNDSSCPGPEKQLGRAWIDPSTFRLLRIEMTIPDHIDNNGAHVRWSWAVDFAPVTFDAKTFWLPKTIASRAKAHDASIDWSFVATYANYHKLHVTSRILPPDEANKP